MCVCAGRVPLPSQVRLLRRSLGVLHLVDDGLLDVFGVVPVGQVQQDRELVRSTSVPMALCCGCR